MIRPCFLIIDREYAGNISTRKLVIETAKLNVVTAYSGREAIETLQAFPNLDGVVTDTWIEDISFGDLVRALKAIRPDVPLIAINTCPDSELDLADYELNSFEPERLLELLKKIGPKGHSAGGS